VSDCKRSICPVACTLDILGDKWTLLVVRDLIMGKKTYSEFQQSPEAIPTNILAERLKRLQAQDVVTKRQYQDKPVRYEYHLTEKGKALRSVLRAMVKWGNTYIEGTLTPEEIGRMSN
jgi:DNA-binding HxlR family transcriptional regulator